MWSRHAVQQQPKVHGNGDDGSCQQAAATQCNRKENVYAGRHLWEASGTDRGVPCAILYAMRHCKQRYLWAHKQGVGETTAVWALTAKLHAPNALESLHTIICGYWCQL